MNGLNDLERVPVAKQSDEQVKKFVGELRQRCYDAMNDDFQTQLVISYLFEDVMSSIPPLTIRPISLPTT